jgi:ERF superfamily
MASELAVALAKLQTQLPHIAKDETGKVEGVTKNGKPFSYNYQYANLASISEKVLPLLGALGLSFTCQPTMHDGQFVLDYQLRHEGGEAIEGYYPLGNGTPQQMGGWITYARRYCLCAVTGVAPDDDDDDAAATEQAPKAEPYMGGDNGYMRRQAERVRTAHTDPEHARLRQAPPEDYGRAERGPVDVSEFPERNGAAITTKQRNAMHAGFARIGINDRADRLALTTAIINRQITSSNELSIREAGAVLDELARRAEEEAGQRDPV